MTQVKTETKRILALFQPQAWIDDYAIAIDGQEYIDVTDRVLQLPLARIQLLEDCDEVADELVEDSTVALEHDGPFEVHVVDSVCVFFGVRSLSDITDEMLNAARRTIKAQSQSPLCLTPSQLTILETYANGEFKFLAQSPTPIKIKEELDRCGDPLLKFLIMETATSEGCFSREETVRRIETAMNDLSVVHSAVLLDDDWHHQ